MIELFFSFFTNQWTYAIVGGAIATIVGSYLYQKFFGGKNDSLGKTQIIKQDSSPSIQATKVSGGIHQTTMYGETTRTRPSLDIRTDGHSGGSDGVTIFFLVRNDGSETARNIKLLFYADDSIVKEDSIPNLIVNETARVTYEYTNTVYYTKKLTNPKFTLQYTSVDGRKFRSSVTLLQEDRADGNFNLSVRLGNQLDESI